MKELSIEEKAKAYDRALKIAKSWCKLDNNDLSNDDLETLFPELKKSDDERIRKEMIFYFQEEIPQCSIQEHSDKMREFISWLKRQEIECIKLELKAGNSYFCYKSRWERADNETFKKGLIYKCNKDGVLDNFVIKNPEQHFIEIKDERIAWLEKQGEHKKFRDSIQVGDEVTRNSDGVIVNLSQLKRVAKKSEQKLPIEKLPEEMKTIEESLGFTTQKECDEYNQMVSGLIMSDEEDYNNIDPHFGKLINKVESKFKAGNWYQCIKDFFGKGVIFDKNTAYYCAKEGCLQNEYGCHIAIVKDLYDNFKLWTIQDVKDGDVVSNGKMIVIFKYFEEPSYRQHIVAHIGLDTNGDIQITDDTWNLGIDKTKPATKEQRDLLLQKMKEAGYEWDFEKKELKKIELSDVGHEYYSELLKNDTSDNIADYAYQCVYCMSHDWAIENPTWDNVQSACRLGAKWQKKHNVSEDWSEEDEKMIDRVRGIIEAYAFSQSAVDVNGDLCEKKFIDVDIWLKSLKERYTWKPSDAQMRALEYIINNAHNTSYSCKIAKELLEQLKKLKGKEV